MGAANFGADELLLELGVGLLVGFLQILFRLDLALELEYQLLAAGGGLGVGLLAGVVVVDLRVDVHGDLLEVLLETVVLLVYAADLSL